MTLLRDGTMASLKLAVQQFRAFERTCSVPPDSALLRAVIARLAAHGDLDGATQLLQHQRLCGASPPPDDDVTLIVVQALLRSGIVNRARELLDDMLASGTRRDDHATNDSSPNDSDAARSTRAALLSQGFAELMFCLGRMGDVAAVERVFDEVRQRGLACSVDMYCSRLFAHGLSGDFASARQVLAEAQAARVTPLEAVFEAMLECYMRTSHVHKAWTIVELDMPACGLAPRNPDTFVKLLRGFSNRGDVAGVLEACERIRHSFGVDLSHSAIKYHALFDACCQAGQVSHAHQILDSLARAGLERPRHWNAKLLGAHLHSGSMSLDHALELAQSPSTVPPLPQQQQQQTASLPVSAPSSKRPPLPVSAVSDHDDDHDEWLAPTASTASPSPSPSPAPSPSTPTPTQQRLGLLNATFYNSILQQCCAADRLDDALHVLQLMRDNNVSPTNKTYTSLIALYCGRRQPKRALELVRAMKLAGMSPNVRVLNSILALELERRDFVSANVVLDELAKVSKGSVPYHRMGEGFEARGSGTSSSSSSSDDTRALSLHGVVRRITDDGLPIFDHTLASLMHVLAHDAELDDTLAFSTYLQRRGIAPTLKIETALIAAYCRVGDLVHAERILYHDIPAAGLAYTEAPFLVLLRFLLRTGGQHGREHDAVAALLNTMQHEAGVTPTIATYNTLLYSYVRSRDLDSARAVLETITTAMSDGSANTLAPDALTYKCWVRLLVESGEAEDAQRLFAHVCESSDVRPNEDMFWPLLDHLLKLDHHHHHDGGDDGSRATKLLRVIAERNGGLDRHFLGRAIAQYCRRQRDDLAARLMRVIHALGERPHCAELESLLPPVPSSSKLRNGGSGGGGGSIADDDGGDERRANAVTSLLAPSSVSASSMMTGDGASRATVSAVVDASVPLLLAAGRRSMRASALPLDNESTQTHHQAPPPLSVETQLALNSYISALASAGMLSRALHLTQALRSKAEYTFPTALFNHLLAELLKAKHFAAFDSLWQSNTARDASSAASKHQHQHQHENDEYDDEYNERNSQRRRRARSSKQPIRQLSVCEPNQSSQRLYLARQEQTLAPLRLADSMASSAAAVSDSRHDVGEEYEWHFGDTATPSLESSFSQEPFKIF